MNMQQGQMPQPDHMYRINKFSLNAKKVKHSGFIPLSPSQEWFFRENFENIHHHNQSVLLVSNKKTGFDLATVNEAFTMVTAHHDILRARFIINGNNVKQYIESPDIPNFDLGIFCYNYRSEYSHLDEMTELTEYLQRSLHITNGPLIRLGLYHTDNAIYLLIVVHSLIIDGISWKTLLEDFYSCYTKLQNGKKHRFTITTAPYATWTNHIKGYSYDTLFEQEAAYLKTIKGYSAEIKELTSNQETQDKNRETVSIPISKRLNKALLKHTHDSNDKTVQSVLLTAMGLTVKELTGKNACMISIYDQSRSSVPVTIDAGHTIGNFSTAYPLVLDLNNTESAKDAHNVCKAALRQVPYRFTGYSAYSTSASKGSNEKKETPFIHYNHRGSLRQIPGNKLFKIYQKYQGEEIPDENRQDEGLYIDSHIIDDKLYVKININPIVHDKVMINKFIQLFPTILKRVLK